MPMRTTASAVSLTSTLVVLLLSPSAVAAQRGGFIIGFGIGPGLVSIKPEINGLSGTRQNNLGVFTDFRIGYAPSQQLAIYYSSQVAFFKLDDPLDQLLLNVSGVGGIGVMYFLPSDRPLSVNGSLGFATFGTILDDGTTDTSMGLGLTLGAGLALSDVAFFNVNLLYGAPGDGSISYRTLGLSASLALLSM